MQERGLRTEFSSGLLPFSPFLFLFLIFPFHPDPSGARGRSPGCGSRAGRAAFSGGTAACRSRCCAFSGDGRVFRSNLPGGKRRHRFSRKSPRSASRTGRKAGETEGSSASWTRRNHGGRSGSGCDPASGKEARGRGRPLPGFPPSRPRPPLRFRTKPGARGPQQPSLWSRRGGRGRGCRELSARPGSARGAGTAGRALAGSGGSQRT